MTKTNEKPDKSVIESSTLLEILAKSFEAMALDLNKRDVEKPDLGKKYQWNHRANIMRDISKALAYAASDSKQPEDSVESYDNLKAQNDMNEPRGKSSFGIYSLDPAPWGDDYRLVEMFERKEDAQSVLDALEKVNILFHYYRIVEIPND